MAIKLTEMTPEQINNRLRHIIQNNELVDAMEQIAALVGPPMSGEIGEFLKWELDPGDRSPLLIECDGMWLSLDSVIQLRDLLNEVIEQETK